MWMGSKWSDVFLIGNCGHYWTKLYSYSNNVCQLWWTFLLFQVSRSNTDGCILTWMSFHSGQHSRSGSELVCCYSCWIWTAFPRCAPHRRSAPCLECSTIHAIRAGLQTQWDQRKTVTALHLQDLQQLFLSVVSVPCKAPQVTSLTCWGKFYCCFTPWLGNLRVHSPEGCTVDKRSLSPWWSDARWHPHRCTAHTCHQEGCTFRSAVEAECLHRNVNKHQSVGPHTHSWFLLSVKNLCQQTEFVLINIMNLLVESCYICHYLLLGV